MILLNILVLVFEILYYSMFMYYAKGEGKFKRYLLLFSLITIIMIFTGTNSLYSYLIFVLTTLYGLKYIVKVKTSLYDMLVILIILFIKFVIEIIFYYLLLMFSKNIFLNATIYGVIKTFIIFILGNNNIIKFNYRRLNKLWNNNNFYIRYIFSCLGFIYVILTCVYILNMIF